MGTSGSMETGGAVGSREEILASLRAAKPAEAALPGLPELTAIGIRFPDAAARFAQAMVEVGGACVRVANEGAIEAALAQLPAYAEAKKVCSVVPGVAKANVDLGAVADPHELRDVDFAVLRGELGVAESGAVWVLERGMRQRAVCFLAQNIAVVLPAAQLVHNLHEAYERVAVGGPGFSMWLSGPSKTADIEQALVIGAHGARSCTVLLVG